MYFDHVKKLNKTFIVLGVSAATLLAGCGNVQSVNTLDGMTSSTGFDGIYRKPVNLNYPSQTRFLVSNG
ncbi:MAG: hypothetical protein ACI83E_002148, partial [Sulfitobacter sp.]